MRAAILPAVLFGLGATLLFSEVRWFHRRPLLDRVAPYLPGPGLAHTSARLSTATFRDVLQPLLSDLGDRASGLLGSSENLHDRLERMHSVADAPSIRFRQFGLSAAALVAGLIVSRSLALPTVAALIVVVGAPLLVFLLVENATVRASADVQERIFLELPVVTEQLGMLLSAGYSLGAGLDRLGARGQGACSRDLQVVMARVRQGVTETAALHEWADRADVAELDRLVAVLGLERDTSDLGQLIAEEARTSRGEAHRQMLEVIERRSQQVWIPVTVATLVPGVLFLAVPFLEAMQLFSSS